MGEEVMDVGRRAFPCVVANAVKQSTKYIKQTIDCFTLKGFAIACPDFFGNARAGGCTMWTSYRLLRSCLPRHDASSSQINLNLQGGIALGVVLENVRHYNV
jgi:hypothetical protein